MKEKINEEKQTIKQWIYNEKTKNFSINFYNFLPNNYILNYKNSPI